MGKPKPQRPIMPPRPQQAPVQAGDIANIVVAAKRALHLFGGQDLLNIAVSIARLEGVLQMQAAAEQQQARDQPPAPAADAPPAPAEAKAG